MPLYDITCPNEHEVIDFVKKIHDPFPLCTICGAQTEILWRQAAPGVNQDSIEGGILVRHGVCWPDGTPRRFYSKTEIKRAANEAGLVIGGDTPGKPYRVNWSGRKRNGEDS